MRFHTDTCDFARNQLMGGDRVQGEDSGRRSSRGCKHGRTAARPPLGAYYAGERESHCSQPTEGGGSCRSSLASAAFKNCFLCPTKEHTHRHTHAGTGTRASNKLGGLITSLYLPLPLLSPALASLIIDNFCFGSASPALISNDLGCQLFSWKPGTRRRRLESSKLKMYRAPATLSWRWQ